MDLDGRGVGAALAVRKAEAGESVQVLMPGKGAVRITDTPRDREQICCPWAVHTQACCPIRQESPPWRWAKLGQKARANARLLPGCLKKIQGDRAPVAVLQSGLRCGRQEWATWRRPMAGLVPHSGKVPVGAARRLARTAGIPWPSWEMPKGYQRLGPLCLPHRRHCTHRLALEASARARQPPPPDTTRTRPAQGGPGHERCEGLAC